MEPKKFNWKSFWSKAGKVLNVSWKVALSVIGVLAAILIICLINEQREDHYGKDAHYWDRDLSENICVHVFSHGNVQVYDREAEKYTTPKLKWVADAPLRDSLTVFCDKDGKRGFINVYTGEIVIEGRYEHAWVFSEGLAAVVETGGKMGFIDNTGEYVIAPELEYFASHDYLFKHGVCCIQNRERKQGLIGRDGEWMYPQEYDYISWTDAPSGEGLILYKDFRAMHVSLDGTVLNDFLVDETSELKYMVKYNSYEADEYEISDKVLAFRVFSLWGVMDKQTGKVLIPAMYGDVNLASETVIKCSLEKCESDNNVLYDLKGNKIEQ